MEETQMQNGYSVKIFKSKIAIEKHGKPIGDLWFNIEDEIYSVIFTSKRVITTDILLSE